MDRAHPSSEIRLRLNWRGNMAAARALLLATLLAGSSRAWGQDFGADTDSDFRAQHQAAQLADSGRVPMLIGEEPGGDSLVTMIVEFVEPPMYLNGAAGVAATAAPYETRFQELASDLGGAAMRKGGDETGRGEVLETFHRVFFGAAVRIPRKALADLAALPYVRRVYPDAEVRAFLEGSVAQIRADQVWTQLDTRGEGVTVGIIDSGVDYLHPALGGGIGPGFKVTGGYDFVNGDADPMDDAGHGTHVAGIVAADGEGVRGVAPGARIVAYKVLNERGRGATSDIIKAIERTVDPNEDGDLSDRLDVVNLSLGSDYGMPDDPAAVAVDNATRLGVTFVVAAGNAGDPIPTEGKGDNYYYDASESMGSPGTAALAITVGAVDRADGMARFSSKGPVALTFAVKPDVVAPGVDIRSTWLNGGFERKNGTSMATPHVAGVAALLKALHPGWTPAQVKAALANTALDLAQPVMKQGAGRIDALRAATVQTWTYPTHLSFGMDDAAQPVWQRQETVVVHNRSAQAQQYTASFSGLRSGINMSAAPQTLTVPAGDSAEVAFTLSVDNALIPVVAEDIEVYGGVARLSGTVDAIHLPWSFSRTAVITLTFSEPAPRFIGASPQFFFMSGFASPFNKVRWLTPRHAEVYGSEAGTYGLATVFESQEGPPRIVIAEDVPIGPSGGAIHVDASSAVHPVYFDGVDDTGGLLRERAGARQLLYMFLPGGIGWMGAGIPSHHLPSALVSEASREVLFNPVQIVSDVAGTGRVYVPHFATKKGLSGEWRIENAPGAYVRQHLHFRVPPSTGRVKLFGEFALAFTDDEADQVYGSLLSVDTLDVPSGGVEAELYLAPQVSPPYFTAPAFHLNYSDLGDRSDLSTRYFSIDGGRIAAGMPSALTSTDYRSPSGDTLVFGGPPVVIQSVSHNNSFGAHSIHFYSLFRGAHREDRFADILAGRYTIYDAAGTLVKTAPLGETREPLEVAPGAYRLEIVSEAYYLREQRGKATLVNTFDLTKAVPHAPTFFSLHLFDASGKPDDAFRQGEAARMTFSAKFVSASAPLGDLTTAHYRRHGTTEWKPLPVAKIADETLLEGTVFQVDLAEATAEDSVAVDLRLSVSGTHDNAAELVLEPAFAVGSWRVGTGSGNPGEKPPAVPVLHSNFPNPFSGRTRIEFSLPAAQEVTVSVFDLLGREVATLVEEHRAAGENAVDWDARDRPSGVYFVRLTAGGHTITRKMAIVR